MQVDLLSTVGGDNANDMTWNAVSTIMTMPMAQSVSWRTKKDKTTIADLFWTRAVTGLYTITEYIHFQSDAVFKKDFPGVTREVIHKRIIRWVKKKSEILGRRKTEDSLPVSPSIPSENKNE